MFNETLKRLETLEPLIEAVDREDITTLSEFLYDRIIHPDSYVVFLGETSSGKTSILNGFIERDLLPVKAIPTTAAITELAITGEPSEDNYSAIFQDARCKKINKEEFLHLSEHPTDDLSRLRLTIHSDRDDFSGLKIFDTPGYNSIIDKHEEVLKDFIPNSDAVVYVINYRTGIQRQNGGLSDDDFVFLSLLKELIRKDVEVILVINRCPEGTTIADCRVQEVVGYAQDLLAKTPKVFLFQDTTPKDGDIHALPYNKELWDYIKDYLHSEERLLLLKMAFDGYVKSLYQRCDHIIQTRYASALMSDDEHNKLIEIERETAYRIRDSIETIIEPTFKKLIDDIPGKVQEARLEIDEELEQALSVADTTDKDEMIAYTNVHLLPFTIGHVSKNVVSDYIEVILTDLNKRLDDYIQKEIIEFNNKITVQLYSNLDIVSKNIAGKILRNVGENAVGKYFIQYGGMGGVNAGIANGASHLLKQVGDLFGKTFSRETHNSLKHFLRKIGATSMKAVGAAIAVVVELVFVLYDYATWKQKLSKKVHEGVEAWTKEVVPGIQCDLIKLKEKNIETVREIAIEIENTFEEDISHDADYYLSQVRLSETIGKQFI